MNSITDNEEFWRNIRPFWSDKVTGETKISLFEKRKTSLKVGETFCNIFENAINKLGI